MSSSHPIASVIIPAHNEAATISQTLTTLTSGARSGELEIVVVCNGCTDDTATIARGFDLVEVVEIEQPSKLAALRAGDRHARVFPRVYLDADIELQTAAVRSLVHALSEPGILVGGVPGRLDLSGLPFLVKLFYEFRERLPVFVDGGIGAGVYALTEQGRSRFEDWPDLRSGDDQFIFRLFSPDERATVRDYQTIVRPPDTMRAVVRRGVRTRRGNVRLSTGAAGRPLAPPPAGRPQALRDAARSPRGIASAVVFVAVTAFVRLRARLGKSGSDWTTR